MSHVASVLHWLPYAVAVWLFMVGLYGVVTSRHLVHLIISLSVAQSSTYIVLLAVGYLHGAGAPVFSDVPRGTPAVDPIVQALAFTDIVVGATVSALLLSITAVLKSRGHSVDPQRLRPLYPAEVPRHRTTFPANR
jgi:multicomponent Na+:H+ antiporter subunit C